jgi:hypothetical protein
MTLEDGRDICVWKWPDWEEKGKNAVHAINHADRLNTRAKVTRSSQLGISAAASSDDDSEVNHSERFHDDLRNKL